MIACSTVMAFSVASCKLLVASCQSHAVTPPHMHTHTHTHARYRKCIFSGRQESKRKPFHFILRAFIARPDVTVLFPLAVSIFVGLSVITADVWEWSLSSRDTIRSACGCFHYLDLNNTYQLPTNTIKYEVLSYTFLSSPLQSQLETPDSRLGHG